MNAATVQVPWVNDGVTAPSKPDAISAEHPLRVVVAGGGVGGLLSAKYLKMQGFDVVVIEKTNEFRRFGGPIQLASNALSCIKAIDEKFFSRLMDYFTFTGVRTNGIKDGVRTEWYCKFDAITQMADMFKLPYTGVIDRPDLQAILMEDIGEGVVFNSQTVVGYENTPQGVTVKLEDGGVVHGDVLVGADGIWSQVRAQMWNENPKGDGAGASYSGYTVFAGETIYEPGDYWDVGYKVSVEGEGACCMALIGTLSTKIDWPVALIGGQTCGMQREVVTLRYEFKNVYIGPGQYFVTSDVGRGRMQWYSFLALPPGSKSRDDNIAYLKDVSSS
ncbi:unnamed protein product [Discosporangium mesarthrocarpum]